ncbi:MAG: hypothetical protein DSY77_14275 [Bacteroidetes bacterium]|nr:MAG: hypothetical protein DSY77_14275 [Bacteroidota bacterium]
MAKKDKKDEEYKDENLHNEPEQDDEDFGLPDLDDDTDSSDSEDDNTSVSKDSDQDNAETSDEKFTLDQDDEYDPNPFGDDDDDEVNKEEPVSTYTPPKKQSAAPIIITLSIIVIIACALVYFFFLREPEKEPVAKEPVKDTTSYVVEKPVEPEPEVIEPEPEPTEGVVSTLNSRTGRSYVVVGSFFDEDLAKDYADKLSKEGTNAYIIPPFGKSKFNRVAIEETESFAAASTRATELSGQFKEQPWPLKY